MKYTLKAYSIWEQGPREKQEDSIYPKHNELVDTDRLFILCDGMGGHSAGEIASSTVCSAMSGYILSQITESEDNFSDEDFKAALNEAYDALDKKDNGAAKKMGTTLTFLKLHDAGCTIAHIGDSRVYHIRPGKSAEDTKILFQTEDHSLVNDLVKIGELTREEAKHSKQKNVITRAMQPCMERRSKADLYHSEDIMPGDYFMLCSDGILEQMEDDNIKYIFSAKGGDISNKIDILIKATAHNHDNHSAILVNITNVEGVVPENGIKHAPELLMAQETATSQQDSSENVTDRSNAPNPKKRKHNYSAQSPMHQLIKSFIYCIIWAIVILGGYYLYKNLKDSKGPTKAEDTTNPTPQEKPSSPQRLPYRETTPIKEQDENDNTSQETQIEEKKTAESSESSVTETFPHVSPEILDSINTDNDSKDIPKSDDQIAKDAINNQK